MPVFQASPAEGSAPTRGVIVVQDAFGVTGYLEGVAADLAEAGWCALAPSLYHRDGSPVVPFDQFPQAERYLQALTGPGLLSDLDACLDHLASLGIPAPRSAVIGFCMGGTVAFFAATERPIGAAVTFYGQAAKSGWDGVDPAVDRVASLQAPWLGLFGEADPVVPMADVDRLRAALDEASVPTELITYPDAGHAFHRFPTPSTFHPQAASHSWRACTEWLDRYVPVSPPMALSRPEHDET
jgi:carboxymethylenebutenolidase